MSASDLEIDAAAYTILSGFTSAGTILAAAIYANAADPPALVVAVGCALLTLVASRRRTSLLKRAEELRALEKAGLD